MAPTVIRRRKSVEGIVKVVRIEGENRQELPYGTQSIELAVKNEEMHNNNGYLNSQDYKLRNAVGVLKKHSRYARDYSPEEAKRVLERVFSKKYHK